MEERGTFLEGLGVAAIFIFGAFMVLFTVIGATSLVDKSPGDAYAAGWCEARGTPVVVKRASGDMPPVCAVVVP